MKKLVLHTEPAEEPVSVAECKTHSRITDTNEDTLIGAYITAARQLAEQICGRSFVEQTWKYYLDEFPNCREILLPYPPLIGSVSIDYTDEYGDPQTFDSGSYYVDNKAEPGRVLLNPDYLWPSTLQDAPNTVIITYTAGYGDATSVPEGIKLAIKFLVGHWFENREPTAPGLAINEVPKTFDYLLGSFRMWRLS